MSVYLFVRRKGVTADTPKWHVATGDPAFPDKPDPLRSDCHVRTATLCRSQEQWFTYYVYASVRLAKESLKYSPPSGYEGQQLCLVCGSIDESAEQLFVELGGTKSKSQFVPRQYEESIFAPGLMSKMNDPEALQAQAQELYSRADDLMRQAGMTPHKETDMVSMTVKLTTSIDIDLRNLSVEDCRELYEGLRMLDQQLPDGLPQGAARLCRSIGETLNELVRIEMPREFGDDADL